MSNLGSSKLVPFQTGGPLAIVHARLVRAAHRETIGSQA